MINIVIGGPYKHHKGKLYKVLGVAKHSETLEEYVYYECLYDNPNGRYWIRPKKMFLEEIEIHGEKTNRFTLIEDK